MCFSSTVVTLFPLKCHGALCSCHSENDGLCPSDSFRYSAMTEGEKTTAIKRWKDKWNRFIQDTVREYNLRAWLITARHIFFVCLFSLVYSGNSKLAWKKCNLHTFSFLIKLCMISKNSRSRIVQNETLFNRLSNLNFSLIDSEVRSFSFVQSIWTWFVLALFHK